jgi:hypothetical protein
MATVTLDTAMSSETVVNGGMGAWSEDFFGSLGAKIDLHLVMNGEDLRASMSAMARG